MHHEEPKLYFRGFEILHSEDVYTESGAVGFAVSTVAQDRPWYNRFITDATQHSLRERRLEANDSSESPCPGFLPSTVMNSHS